MTRYGIPLISLVLLIAGCTKSSPDLDAVISNLRFSAKTIVADGSSTLSISVTLNPNADSTKRNVLFTASAGSFVNGHDTSISQKAIFVNEQLTSTVNYIAPVQPGIINFIVRPDLPSYHDLSLKDSITASVSLPSKVKINASSFSVPYGFTGEDTMTAKIFNADGNGVSLGTKVIIADDIPAAPTLHGRFRAVSTSSNANSQVSALYSPGFIVPPGTDIYITITALDAGGAPAGKDSVLITVIQ